jgi:bifunctional DNA-binding transcriptional regulator/antitoxin component of YhaV-PrlF toxin-antitoxin module
MSSTFQHEVYTMLATSQTSYKLQVSEDGTLTLPPELRAAMGIETGDTLTLIQGEGEVWFIPTRLLMPELAKEMEKLMAEKGLTLDDMLAGLAEEGEKLFKEQYGDIASG